MQSSSIARLFGAFLAAGIGVAPAAAQEGAAPPAVAAPAVAAPAPALAPDAVALKAALQAAMAELPADRRSAIDGFFAARELCARSGPSRAAHGPTNWWRRSRRPTGRACRAAATSPTRWRCIFDTPGDEGAAAAREVAAMRRLSAAWRPTSRSGSSILPGSVRRSASIRRRRRPRRCWPRSPTRRCRRRCRRSRRQAPTMPGSSPRRRGSRRWSQAEAWGPAVSEGETLHPGDSGPRVAELRARLARLGYVVPTAETAGERLRRRSGAVGADVPARLRPRRRRRGRARTLAAVNAPVETRLRAGGGEPRAACAGCRAISASAISSSTSPTSP